MRSLLGTTVLLLLINGALGNRAWAADAARPEEGFVSLFDGKTLHGWKAGENASYVQVRDGMIVMECPETKDERPVHLFYVGEVNRHEFKNFDLKIDVMTFPGANSGIYFHTKYQAGDWPVYGLECQINNSHDDWRRTGSLYGIKNLAWGPEKPASDNKEDVSILPKPPVVDNVWYTQEIVYQNGRVLVKLNGRTLIDYRLGRADVEHKITDEMTWLPRGTFGLQGHPPMPKHISKVCFKNIRIKVLPD